MAKKLKYALGVLTVERQVRGKWVCAKCMTLVSAPVAPHHWVALTPYLNDGTGTSRTPIEERA